MTDPSLKTRLLALQPLDAAREQQLKQEIAAMWNQKLTRANRVSWIVSACAALFVGLPGSLAGAWTTPDPWIRAIWLLSVVLSVASAGFAVRVLRRGSVNFHAQLSLGKVSSGITFFTALLLVGRTIANPSLEAVGWALLGVVWLLLSLAVNLWNRIIQAESTTREHLLRLELRLMEGSSRNT